MTTSAEVLEVIAEETHPRQVEKNVAQFNPALQPKRRRGREKVDPYERFMAKVKKGPNPDDCWIYAGSVRFHVSSGGSRKKRKNKAVEFRKYMWQQVYGTDPPAKLFAHCRNGKCCNPKHIKPEHPGWIQGERKVMEVDAKKRKDVPSTIQPLHLVPPAPEAPSPEQALTSIIQTLGQLDEVGRTRVIAALKAFYP